MNLRVARGLAVGAAVLLLVQLALPWAVLAGVSILGLEMRTSAIGGHPESGVPVALAAFLTLAGSVAAAGSFLIRPAKITGPVGLAVSAVTVAVVVPTAAVAADQKLSPHEIFPAIWVWAPAWCMVAAFLLLLAAALTSPTQSISSSTGMGATAETS